MPTKTLRCKQCRDYFPRSTMQKRPVGWFHSDECLLTYVRAVQDRARAKAERKARRLYQNEQKAVRRKHRAEKEHMKTRTEHLRDAQSVFNRYIRLRDADQLCISCQNPNFTGRYHAGHFFTTKAHPEKRFLEDNCHRQCSACNVHLSGNVLNYRQALLVKIGKARLDALESHKPLERLTIDEIQAIKSKYLKRCREFN